jgi:hypothetical protein
MSNPVSDGGGSKSPNGRENFWQCGRPAKFRIVDRLRGPLVICGMHARFHNQRQEARFKRWKTERRLAIML